MGITRQPRPPRPNHLISQLAGRVALVAWLATGSWGTLVPSSLALPAGQPSSAPIPQPLIPLAEPEGQSLLIRSTARSDHGPLAQWFETQANLAYCGVASAVMVLNSLAAPAPEVPGFGTYHFWTQTNVFSIPGSRGYVRPEVVAKEGMTLAQLQGLLASNPKLVVERFHGDHLSLAQWRAILQRSLQNPRDRLVVNYERSALGQASGGHISPVAAYDAAMDRALILDVARYRYPSVWVSARDLWRAMRTPDASSGRSRGLLVIRLNDPHPSLR